MYDSDAAHDGADAYAVLMETLRVTAPENWPVAIEALKQAHDEYVLIYEHIYNQAYAAQKGGESASSTWSEDALTQSQLLTSVETTLLGWDPVQLPTEDPTATSAASPGTGTGNDTQHLYQQVTHQGLPYLLCISATPLAIQRSEAMAALLQRMATLKTVIDKLEYVAMLGQIAQAHHPTLFGARDNVSGATGPAESNGSAAAARTMAFEQGGVVATASRLARSTADVLRSITFADASAVILPMLFVGFKVGVLLSVMLRGADTMKKYFVLGMASVYVIFESYRIVQRRMRARQRMTPRVPAPAPQGDGNAGQAPAAAEAQGNGTLAPMGANVPTAPSHEQAAERQATEDPSRPLPPPQAPLRITARRFTYDWWIDHMAFVGLDIEDGELGLVPAASVRTNQTSRLYSLLCSSWILPPLLFLVTMSPAVEQRRKRAIEERERVIRKWTRLEAERRERLTQMQQPANASAPVFVDVDLQQKRSDYADRILRQRRATEADADDDDMARQVARDEDDLMDMNVF